MKVYKGTDKDMKCRGFQYELGKTEKQVGRIYCCEKGFHSCEAPFDVLKFYPMRNGNRYFAAEADGKISKSTDGDSKLASSEITLKAEIGIKDLIKAQVEFTRRKAESGTASGDLSNLAGGAKSNLAGGASSPLVCRNGCKAKAGKNSVIVLTEWAWENAVYKPTHIQALIVDGKKIKADTWYTLKDGEVKEAPDD